MEHHEHAGGAEKFGHPGTNPEHLIEMESRRRAMFPPEEILPDLLPRPDLTLLDLGCGAGFFSLPAAEILSGGRVYAVDVRQNMVDTTLQRAQERELSNIEGITADASRLPLSDGSVDVVLMSMVFHDIDEKDATLAEIARILKPAGTLFLIEMDRVDGGFGPPMSIRISPDELTQMLTAARFSVIEISKSPRQESIYFTRARVS